MYQIVGAGLSGLGSVNRIPWTSPTGKSVFSFERRGPKRDAFIAALKAALRQSYGTVASLKENSSKGYSVCATDKNRRFKPWLPNQSADIWRSLKATSPQLATLRAAASAEGMALKEGNAAMLPIYVIQAHINEVLGKAAGWNAPALYDSSPGVGGRHAWCKMMWKKKKKKPGGTPPRGDGEVVDEDSIMDSVLGVLGVMAAAAVVAAVAGGGSFEDVVNAAMGAGATKEQAEAAAENLVDDGVIVPPPGGTPKDKQQTMMVVGGLALLGVAAYFLMKK